MFVIPVRLVFSLVLGVCRSISIRSTRVSNVITSLAGTLLKETQLLLRSYYTGSGLLFVSLFLGLFVLNYIGLTSYTFTWTSHICFSLGLGLTL